MLLCREVLAWLRYKISREPACLLAGIAVEEMSSSLQSLVDSNDGCRTIGIYKADQGYTPRIEVRFTGMYPQVWQIRPGDCGDYITTPANPSFPGNTRAWDCSDFVEYLVLLTKAQFCSCPDSLLSLLTASAAVAAPDLPATSIPSTAKIPLEDIQRILSVAKDRLTKGKRLTGEQVNKWLKEKSSGDRMDFAKSLIVYFKQGKLKWQDMSILQNTHGHGQDVIPWSFFQAQLSDPDLLKKLPPPAADLVAEGSVQKTLDRLLIGYANDRPMQLNPIENVVTFGKTVTAQFRSGKLPLHYLSLMEECDPREKVLPWSFIRRSVIAYRSVTASKHPLPLVVMQWLYKSNLVAPLYNTTQKKFDVLKVVQKHVASHAKDTIENTAWVKEVFKSLASLKSEMDVRRELQVEFDLWLHQALAPSAKDVPLSPHALTSESKQESLYQNMFDTWLDAIRATAEKRQAISVKTMTIALESFYEKIANLWKKEQLTTYKPTMPSRSQIMEIAKSGDKDQFMTLLLSDVEHEIGSPVPEDIRHKLMADAYFNVIFDEIIFQSVKLP